MGVGVEGLANEWASLFVDSDGADFSTVHGFSDVEVTDRGFADGAAPLDLLQVAFPYFGGEVGGVELGEGREHPMHQQAFDQEFMGWVAQERALHRLLSAKRRVH